MGWTAPRTYTVGEIITKAILDTHVKDNLRYLKGLDGVPTIESGLIIDNTGGDEYLQIPSLTTAERDLLTPVNGMLIYNETTTEFNKYENGFWVDLADNTDHGGLDGLADDDHTQYILHSLTTTRGDIITRGAAVNQRLGLGADGKYLKSDGTDVVWGSGVWGDIFVPATYGTAMSIEGNAPVAQLNALNEVGYVGFLIPNDFTTLVSAALKVMPRATQAAANYDIQSIYHAPTAAYNEHTETDAATTYNVTNLVAFEIDVSGILTGIAAGDSGGIKLTESTAGHDVDLEGLRLRYI